jgi:hypothetical protein
VTYTRCRIDTINFPDDGHMAARNMQRTEINIHEKRLGVMLVIYKDYLTELLYTVSLWKLHMDCKSTEIGCDHVELFKLDITHFRPPNMILLHGSQIKNSGHINTNTLANKTGYKRKHPGTLNLLFIRPSLATGYGRLWLKKKNFKK